MLGMVARRFWLGALSALCVTCHVGPSAGPGGGEPTARAQDGAFDPAVASVDPSSALGRARALAAGGTSSEARDFALRELRTAREPERTLLQWIAARGTRGEAAAAAWAAIPEDGPLGRWARLYQARSLRARDPQRTLSLLSPLCAARWAGRDEARAADALVRARTGLPDAEWHLHDAIEQARGPTRVELETALAELLAARGTPEARAEALTWWRWIAARAPTSRAGRDAEASAATLLAGLPDALRAAHALPTLEQRFARADAIASTMDHAAAEAAYAAIASDLEIAPARRCEARFAQGRAMWQRRARREAAALLAQVATDCAAVPDVQATARWYAGRSFWGSDQGDEAIAQYDALAHEQPRHRLADDALVNAARICAERDDAEGARVRLERVAHTMLEGDLRSEAFFLLAWHARADGDGRAALAVLEQSLAEAVPETSEDVRGRSAYWRGRLLEEAGRASDAVGQYEQLARTLPLSYYAQQALGRLQSLDAGRAARALPPRGEAPRLSFPRRPELNTEGFAAAVALLRVGEPSLAERELEAVGLLGEGAPAEAKWIGAALLDRAGEHARACELSRRQLRGPLMESSPSGQALGLWRIAYPRAFHPLIEGAADEAVVPASFVRAIAREESSFRPDVVSPAHAYGLLQLIVPTAQRVARPLGLASDAAALRRPEINVRLGARYIRVLRDHFEQNPALVPAAYNAGEGAVDRWIRARPERALDEFIEEIPYEETRRYARRVLQTWGIYAWLDEGALPAWPTTVR